MKSVAYWTALDEPEKSSSFFYILEHPNREAAAANWKAFQDDPEWKAVKAKSEEKSVGLSPVHNAAGELDPSSGILDRSFGEANSETPH